ncbi:MAG: ABC transporter substrate-binding protein [Candidatus Rokubacteria bacterium]|nr:ABC transporter substrate-binding protein [Candidatus Rokubacteria bacterium]
MRLRAFFAASLVILLIPLLAWAAPQGKVVVAQGVDPTTLDPMNHQETPASNLAANIFDTLLERDQDLNIVPLLAESYRNVAPTTWEFKLRKGIKFHNGEPVDAEAVKFSLERLVDPKLKLRGATPFAPISQVEIVDSHTVRIHTKAPWPILDTLMSAGQAAMLPPKYYREKDMAYVARNPVGSGPFKFVRWVKDEQIELTANEQYWRGAPKIKTLIFRPIPDDAVRVAALQNGEIDIAVNIPPHLANIIANHPRLFLSTAPSVRTIQLMYYTHQFDRQHKLVGPYPGPVADRRIRQAMNYAVDVDEIIRSVLDGKGVRQATMLTSNHFGFDPALKPIKQDLAKTKQLLTEAGFPSGVDMVLNSPQGRYVRDKEVAEAVAGQLTKAGIRTQLKTHEWGSYLNSMVYVHNAGPVWLIGWGTTTYDAETVYVPLFRSGKILSNFHNPDFDRMVDEAQTVMDPKKRLELYHRINRLWVDDAAAMPLYQQLDLYGATKRMVWKARGDERLKGFDMAVK